MQHCSSVQAELQGLGGERGGAGEVRPRAGGGAGRARGHLGRHAGGQHRGQGQCLHGGHTQPPPAAGLQPRGRDGPEAEVLRPPPRPRRGQTAALGARPHPGGVQSGQDTRAGARSQ